MIIEDHKKYEEWLTIIANTRLIYNTMNELEKMMDNRSIHSNGVKRSFPTPQKLRSAFRDLKVEVSLMTDDIVNLDCLMIHYKRAWIFFHDNLARRSNPTKVALELLHYCYPPFMTNGVGKKKTAIFDAIIEQNINIPFLILMLLKAIPGYDSKEGDVIGISHKYEEVMTLMERFTEGCSFFKILPAITQAREEENKSRLMLLFHVSQILDTYEAYINNDNLYAIANNIKQSQVTLDIDGYWNECGGELLYTDFWQIESAMNDGCYFATHWHKDADNRLIGILYTMFLVESADGKLVSYIIHPEAIKHRIKGLQYVDSDHVWYITNMPKEESPTTLPFKRFMPSNVWKVDMNLTKVTNVNVTRTYDNWFKSCEIHKPFKHLEYLFRPSLYAITKSHLYITLENKGEYYKIPRDAYKGFTQIEIGDNVGIMTMNNKTFIAFDELLLYIPITKKTLAKYQIERVNRIE